MEMLTAFEVGPNAQKLWMIWMYYIEFELND